ncbi:hypothetical protein [Fervidicoccus fontis]|nr:hypothetical protein [Fervidicoccus fontis]
MRRTMIKYASDSQIASLSALSKSSEEGNGIPCLSYNVQSSPA